MKQKILIFGGLLLDRYIYINRWPKRGQDAFITDEKNYVGGCAINMAVTVHNLIRSFHNHEIEVHVLSALGQDQTAQEIRTYLQQHSLSEKYIYEQDGNTGSCIVFSEENGERTFLTKKGVEESFTADMQADLTEESVAVVGLTGYYLLGQYPEHIIDCLQRLKKQGTWILFDPSPLVGEIPLEILKSAIEIADLMTPNIEEMSIMEELLGYEVFSDTTIVQKEGAQGGIVKTPEGSFPYEAKSCQTMDTTGAGDSFSGALLFGKAQGLSLKESVEMAVECAAKTVQCQGPHAFWKYDGKIGETIC